MRKLSCTPAPIASADFVRFLDVMRDYREPWERLNRQLVAAFEPIRRLCLAPISPDVLRVLRGITDAANEAKRPILFHGDWRPTRTQRRPIGFRLD